MNNKIGRGEEVTTLYRAVSLSEWEQIKETKKLGTVARSMGGKWFAEQAEHAARWGELLEGRGRFRVIEVQVPARLADTLFRIEKLDGIGPARYIEADQLVQVRVIGRVGD